MLMVFMSLILLLFGLMSKPKYLPPFEAVDQHAHLPEIKQPPSAYRRKPVVHGIRSAVASILVLPPPMRLAL